MRYGIRHLDNYSIHASETLFQYEGVEKSEFLHENRALVSRLTTIVTFLNPDDNLYHEVTKSILAEKEKVTILYGTKLLDHARAGQRTTTRSSSHYPRTSDWSDPGYRGYL